VREAGREDLPSVARIAARREGGDVAPQLAGLERSFGLPDRSLMVAVFEGEESGSAERCGSRPRRMPGSGPG